MNWTCVVFGASLIDYQGSDAVQIIKESRAHLVEAFNLYGWKNIFRSPIPTNPINNAARLLISRYSDNWVRWWAQKSKNAVKRCHLSHFEIASLNMLTSTGGSTVYMTWTYDD